MNDFSIMSNGNKLLFKGDFPNSSVTSWKIVIYQIDIIKSNNNSVTSNATFLHILYIALMFSTI